MKLKRIYVKDYCSNFDLLIWETAALNISSRLYNSSNSGIQRCHVLFNMLLVACIMNTVLYVDFGC